MLALLVNAPASLGSLIDLLVAYFPWILVIALVLFIVIGFFKLIFKGPFSHM